MDKESFEKFISVYWFPILAAIIAIGVFISFVDFGDDSFTSFKERCLKKFAMEYCESKNYSLTLPFNYYLFRGEYVFECDLNKDKHVIGDIEKFRFTEEEIILCEKFKYEKEDDEKSEENK